MATKVLINREKIEAIADGFRASMGTSTKLTLDEMAMLATKGVTSQDSIVARDFEIGGIVAATGENYNSTSRIRTGQILCDAENSISITCNSTVKWLVHFFNNGTWLGKTEFDSKNCDDVVAMCDARYDVTHIRILLAYTNDVEVIDITDLLSNVTIKKIIVKLGLTADVPNTQGQWACLSRASQMCDIKYIPKADMYSASTGSSNYMQAGTEYTGIIYSSVRALDWFIGYTISMYSYLTALNNPKSVIYTKKYTDYFSLSSEEDPDNRANAIVYNVYGTNCSSFVSYCLSLPYLGTTGTIPKRADITRICAGTEKMTDFDALRNELKLCDIAGCIQSHAELVTGIRRDKNGVIQEVDLTDSWPPRIRKITYTWDEFVKHCSVDYDYPFLRYNDLETVTFPENLTGIVYSDIVTNRGDKVCIRPDMDISLNVLNTDGYTGIALFKDGEYVATHSITNSPDWELANLTTGKYTAILYGVGDKPEIDDANETNSTSFIVCAVSLSKNGNIFAYTAEAINGAYPKPMQITSKDKWGFTFKADYINDDNFAGSGSIEVLSDGYSATMFHLPFKTEYGFVIAEYKV